MVAVSGVLAVSGVKWLPEEPADEDGWRPPRTTEDAGGPIIAVAVGGDTVPRAEEAGRTMAVRGTVELHSAVTGVAAAPVPTRLVRPDGAEVGFGLAASCDTRVVMCAATVEVWWRI
jgi:hypothetical protein